jgi:hypothetical protein
LSANALLSKPRSTTPSVRAPTKRPHRKPLNPQTSSFISALFARGRDGSVPLGITLAVGCGLLFLNIVVFVAIFYQRQKATSDVREWRRRQQTMMTSSGLPGRSDGDQLDFKDGADCDSYSEAARGPVDTDSNSSLSVALCPSKSPAPLPLHHHHHHHHRHQHRQNDVRMATLPPPPSSGVLRTTSDDVAGTMPTRGCRRTGPPIGDQESNPNADPYLSDVKEIARRQHQSPVSVSVLVNNHHQPACFDNNPSTTV